MSNDDQPRSRAAPKLRRRRCTSVRPNGNRRRAWRLFLDRKTLRRALQYVHERRFRLETAEHVYHEDLGLPPVDDVIWHIP